MEYSAKGVAQSGKIKTMCNEQFVMVKVQRWKLLKIDRGKEWTMGSGNTVSCRKWEDGRSYGK